ncbi:unnamed protein product [Ostreobium quekettii]|uniref:Uncharacterized protein n=1 Tax=Ostreobium quekettii TaxID=121088 RepID=A0A8S1JDW0_9CHLO|nr:unnamed protein product [Ostreobium quekettii]
MKSGNSGEGKGGRGGGYIRETENHLRLLSATTREIAAFFRNLHGIEDAHRRFVVLASRKFVLLRCSGEWHGADIDVVSVDDGAHGAGCGARNAMRDPCDAALDKWLGWKLGNEGAMINRTAVSQSR